MVDGTQKPAGLAAAGEDQAEVLVADLEQGRGLAIGVALAGEVAPGADQIVGQFGKVDSRVWHGLKVLTGEQFSGEH